MRRAPVISCTYKMMRNKMSPKHIFMHLLDEHFALCPKRKVEATHVTGKWNNELWPFLRPAGSDRGCSTKKSLHSSNFTREKEFFPFKVYTPTSKERMSKLQTHKLNARFLQNYQEHCESGATWLHMDRHTRVTAVKFSTLWGSDAFSNIPLLLPVIFQANAKARIAIW